MKCKKGFDIEVLKSGAGYYVGTLYEGWEPNCRITEYFSTEKTTNTVLEAMKEGIVSEFYMRDCIENEFCNGGLGCFEEGK